MTDYSDGHARQLEDILEDLSAGRSTVEEAAEWIRRQSPQMLHRPLRPRPRRLGVVVTTVGFLFLVMAFVIGWNSQQFTENSVTTQAQVTELLPGKNRPRPRYEYAVEGTSYTGTAETGTDRPDLKVGDTIEIEYLRDQPFNSRVASWGERWTGTVAVGVLGGMVTFVGLVILLLTSRR